MSNHAQPLSPAPATLAPKKKSKENSVWRRLLKNKLAMIGLVIIAIMVIFALFAPLIATHGPNEMDLANSLSEPGIDGHLLGTDNYGRDLFSRIVYGTRISLIVGIFAIGLGGMIGTLLGLLAGYYGGKWDALIMRLMDGLFAFPFILLSISLMTVLGAGLFNVILAIGIANIPGFARIVRGQVLAVKEEEYIEVTRSLGANDSRIIFHHILPNCMAPIIVYATMHVAGAIISEAALSFLGLGVQPPTASWGSILKDGKDFLVLSPHMATFSGLAILLSVLGFNLFGDGLRDALDPKMKV
ncbi:peptide ABC transporter substrate-binding protein [Brevibacillus agri]|jgi:peptide/nickel transport system permease protein|uniref:ABC transporter permease n=1 Tax=Brevibacillus agri TaxID=51101 RepID=A0A3M8ATN8_9BACL|nr:MULTISPECIES: ABC transporter permease [Brevibacillus]EJL41992.1 ABC-type dipeptide/oligopeptide/nickel transport system, permease component [Brevibacillus sp. CF112]MBG9566791.1 peptide ABC transporter permease [Brevibacillus agri]MBY0050593.1 ABC transporter permease [Brevibacillus agri]MCG5251912.1 ABC transporter permease [Brevibacillus agri]MDN4094037.1 ABC transporter permease [Brevibacillus agri]